MLRKKNFFARPNGSFVFWWKKYRLSSTAAFANQFRTKYHKARRTPRCYITLFSNWRKLSLTWVLVPHFATIDFFNRLWNKSCPLSSIGARISKSSEHGKRVADIGRQIRVQVEFSSWHWCNWRETGDHPATTQLGLPFLRLQRKQQHCPPRCLWAWLPVHLDKCGNEWP